MLSLPRANQNGLKTFCSQDDFNVRWDAIFWPGKLTKQLEQAHENLIEIEEELKKIQLKDANEFQVNITSPLGRKFC